MEFFKGSEWRKWDLHVHTPYSYVNNFPEWNQYVRKLKEEAVIHDIEVMGVTDYFSVDGYEKLLNECETGTLNENPRILLSNGKYLYLIPIIELRLENFPSNEISVNLHVAFSPKILPSTIRNSFLENLSIRYQSKNLKCKESDLIKIGDAEDNSGNFNANLDISQISSQEKNNKTEKALRIITFSSSMFEEKLEEFKKLLLDSGIKEESYLLLIANKGHGGLSDFKWTNSTGNTSRAGIIRQNLLNISDICFSNNKNDRKFLLGEAQDTNIQEILSRFRTLKPCVWGSDAHSVDELFHPSNGNSNDYTWIKADPTFEGLKQIIFEPDFRVKIQENNPRLEDSKLVIDSLDISGSLNYIISDEHIEFNRDMVCIIGGRGSGKSALLETLAYCFNVHLQNEDPPSLIPYFRNIDAEANFLLHYRNLDGNLIDPFLISLQTNNEAPCSYPFLYISQNKIEKFAADEKTLHILAFDTVVKNSSFSEQLSNLQSQIDDLIKKIESNNQKLLSQRDLIRDTDIKATDIETSKLREELKLLESDSTREILTKLQNAREKKDLQDKAKNLLGDFVAYLEEIEITLKNKKDELNGILDKIGIKYTDIGIDFSIFREYLSQIDLNLNSSTINELYKASFEEAKTIVKNKIDVSVEHIESIRNKILNNELSIKEFQKEKNLYSNLIKLRYLLLTKLNSFYNDYERIYKSAVEEFSTTNRDILGSLELKTELLFDTEYLIDILFSKYIDRRKIKSKEKLRENLELPISLTYDKYIEWINNLFTEKFNIDNYDIFYSPFKIEIEKEILLNYPRLSTKFNYKLGQITKSIGQLSLGQKGTILLKLFLSIGNNCPIIIDQPEDHLDNAFIYSDLVQTIRNAKKKRQIIVVTHNANLVVNGDAEQVIVAEYENERITHFVSGSLEDSIIKDKVTTILEGGMEAFRKREKKYKHENSIT